MKRRPLFLVLLCALVHVLSAWQVASADALLEQLQRAGENRQQIELALKQVPEDERAGLEFLVLNMPQRDLATLSADYLLENVHLAYQARLSAAWGKAIPEEIFLNAVLPYASVNERRDNWRADFRKRFLPLVKDAKSPAEAAAILNRKVFAEVGVKYSTKRNKADQSPYESMECGLASCTGLSILLIDACRSVGVPARFVGTPLWSNDSGNHSWVEIWDDGWHFTGAAEPTGDELDRGWFVAAASKAVSDDPRYAIYATSFRKTPLRFPCVWNPRINDIPAVNVTSRYNRQQVRKPDGHVHSLLVVKDESGVRVATKVTILCDGKIVFTGKTNDEGFDSNDHLRVALPAGRVCTVQMESETPRRGRTITPASDDQLFEFRLEAVSVKDGSSGVPADAARDETAATATMKALHHYLDTPPGKRRPLAAEEFAEIALSMEEAERVRKMLNEDWLKHVREQRGQEMQSRELKYGDLKMPFSHKKFGEKPATGWSLYISLHGGGGAPARVNDQQWENQKRLYQLKEGIYVTPRAPSNTWNLWHQGHIDPLLIRLIENMVAFEGVDRNRVYLMGYSAGGDGVYQLAPRLADRWAAAAMMAGHPNETSPLGLRNVPFALQVGGRDAAYQRNTVARDWEKRLGELHKADPQGYTHLVKIYPDKGHWMDLEDAVAIPWMAKHERNPVPKRIVWKQDDVTHPRFYWLGVDEQNRQQRSEVVAAVDGQTVTVSSRDVRKLTICLDDRFIDLEQPVTVVSEGKVLFKGEVDRTIASLHKSFGETHDPFLAFPASVTVEIPPAFPAAFVMPGDVPRYSAARVDKPLTIDGKLDEPAWQSASKTSSFVDLISGEKTRHETRATILWDDEFLYVGFRVSEPDVTAKYKKRDDPIYYDNDVEVFIAGQDAYYEFEINAYGTIYEAFFVWNDAWTDDAYAGDPQLKRGIEGSQLFHGVGLQHHPRGPRTAFLKYDLPGLKSAVHIDGTLNHPADTDKGWTVELAFPWKSLATLAAGDKRAVPPRIGDEWRIDLFRFNTTKAPAGDSGGWAVGRHGVWDSHIPEVFPIVTFSK